jgi:hypothetical protein
VAYTYFNPEQPHPKHYKRYFLHKVKPPFVCEHCHEVIDPSLHVSAADGLVVHHLDGNHENISLENLVPLHRRCHPTMHNTGMKRTPETRNRMSTSMTRVVREHPEYWEHSRFRGPNPNARRPKHEGFGVKQRNAQRTSRMRECECGLRTNAGSMSHHLRKTGHVIVSA